MLDKNINKSVNKHPILISLFTSLLLVACQPNQTESENTDSDVETMGTDAQTSQTKSNDDEENPELGEANDTSEPDHKDHIHDLSTETGGEVEMAYMEGMNKMHDDMMAGMQSNDADVAFAKGMLPHHQGAVDMAEVQLKYGKDDTMRKLAEDIIEAQKVEIEQMQKWIDANPDTEVQENTEAVQKAYDQSMQDMHDDMMEGIKSPDPDMAYAKGMLPHHRGAVDMAEIELKYGKDDEMRKLAQNIIDAQESEILLMEQWIVDHS